ncbi:MAG TPA: aminotransferase class IV, partial [Ferruginibacter sp.]|nr:aminotransferase class IV [Ferruginibacter sp.]
MPSILWNGQLLNSDTPLVRPDSLTVRYGIGVFETMRCDKGTLLFVEDHVERLTRALHALSIPVEPVYNHTDLTEQARNLMHHHTLESGRIRISVLSNGDNPPDYLMSCAPLPAPESQPLHIDFSSHFGVMASPVSFFKNINYQHYLLAADEAKQRGLDDVILLNQHQRICETSISNIFCR